MATQVTAPDGTALTKVVLVTGGAVTGLAAYLVVARLPAAGAWCATGSAALLLLGGHRANHGSGTAFDRMLDAVLDRLWDGAVLGAIAWAARGRAPNVTAGALTALGASFLSSYVRARGAALGYSVEESHVMRGLRYALVAAGLAFGWLGWTLWVTAALALLASLVRTMQVAREERV